MDTGIDCRDTFDYHYPTKTFGFENKNIIGQNLKIVEDRSHYISCYFEDFNFNSYLRSMRADRCFFKNGSFKDSDLKNSDFYNCLFDNIDFSTWFENTGFYNCTFLNCIIPERYPGESKKDTERFNRCIFKDCTFIDEE